MKYFLAVCIPFIILMLFGTYLIKFLKKLNFGQQIRKLGPDSHFHKKGIPTMGGILIVLAILITTIFLVPLNNNLIWGLIITAGMGITGFVDDFMKIKKGSSLGLKARYKLSSQIILSLLLVYYIYNFTNLGEVIIIPFQGQVYIGKWLIPLIVFTVIGTANAVNLTDGLDGLAAGITAVVTSTFAVINSSLGLESFGLLGLIVTGACIGFLWYNSYPAQVFMGDVGSLALGGIISVLAIFSRTEIFLLIIGGIFVIETISVMMQVVYFKLTNGKRIFKMTPIHHHFELKGMEENKIVMRFLIISMFFASLGLIIFYISI
ncbi:MAG: phospho-N-acetylmuramoyl-pentapeptide-transferase [Bacillota bacterium]